MSEITLKEIPVQIINAPLNSVLVLRAPDGCTEETLRFFKFTLCKALSSVGRHDVDIVYLPTSIDLAILQNKEPEVKNDE